MAYYFVKKKKKFTKKARRIAGVTVASVGVIILLYFFFPVISFKIFFGSADAIQAPIPNYSIVNGNSGLSGLIAQGISGLTVDYTDARNWYPKIKASTSASTPSYSISIPKLKITDAQVSTVDYDLTRHLIQYFGTSIPGEKGTAVIFGHSTLPQLFDPKNYKTIFATLHTIKNGDEIIAKVNNITYTYKVFSINVTGAEDTNMFSQSYDHSYITIVTCTPPGTVWKRLVVRAVLEQVGKKQARLSGEDNNFLAGSFFN